MKMDRMIEIAIVVMAVVMVGVMIGASNGYAWTEYPRDNPKNKPVIVGDSIAQGIARAGGYEEYTIVGIGLDYLNTKIAPQIGYARDMQGITYISIGTNDYYRGYSTPAYISMLNRLDDTLHSQGHTQVCYLIPPVMPARIDKGLGSIREALYSRGCTITLPDTLRAKDGIHYTPQGYKGIAHSFK